jgi:cyclic dehypoxanthinyl futalosine synthase
MDPARLQEILARKAAVEGSRAPDGEPLSIEDFRPAPRTSELAGEILEAAQERRLTGGELLLLFEEASFADLAAVAHELRLRRADPEVVTYGVDIPVETLTSDPDRGETTGSEAGASVRGETTGSEPAASGRSESTGSAPGARIVLQGDHPAAESLESCEELLRSPKGAYPRLPIVGLGPSDIERFVRESGLAPRAVLERLRDAGLDALSGADAVILDDRVRQLLDPDALPVATWLGLMEEAHGVGLGATATMTFQHVESYPERVEHLVRLRDSQDRTGGYTAFVPWTAAAAGFSVSPRRSELAALIARHADVGVLDFLRTLAVCRVALDNFPIIRAHGIPEEATVAGLALHCGANELGLDAAADTYALIIATGFEPVPR